MARDKRDTSADLSFGNNWRRDTVIRNWGTMRCRSRGRSMRQIKFTDTDKSSILGFRLYEWNSPRFQRSGKKAGGVCVFGGVDAAVGARVGFGFAGCRHGLLRWGDVSVAWACAKEEFGRYQFGEGCVDGRLRASCAAGGDGLQRGVLPSERSGRVRGDCVCAAESNCPFRAAPDRPSEADTISFDKFFRF